MSYDSPNFAIVKSITEERFTASEASVRFKRSRQWIYTLLRRYEEGGPEAVKPRSTAPKTHPTKVSEEVIKQIIKIRRELTSKGADNGPVTIAWVLEQRGFHAPAESTIRRILTKNAMVTQQPKIARKPIYDALKQPCPTNAGKQMSHPPYCSTDRLWRSSTSSMTTVASCYT